MGAGKAQPLTSKVYTPSGPKLMGDMKVGDYVIGMDGLPKRVNSIHPQGVKKVFEVTFNDGSKTECCDEHLWSIRTAGQKMLNSAFRVKQLKDIRNDLLTGAGNNKWSIPITNVVNFESREIVIPPYTLGVMIGDGSLSSGKAVLTNASDHIFSRLEEDVKGLPVFVHRRWCDKDNSYTITISKDKECLRNPVISEIKRYGLDIKSKYKFIPEDYKYNTIEVRLGILGGLLDTDGYVDTKGCVYYTSASKKLVEDVNEIVQSLGGIGSLHHKVTNFGTDAWTTTLKIPNEYLHVISKPFKKDRAVLKTKYTPARYFLSVKEIGEKECQCISVEGEHYLTDDLIVTHNTLSALWLAREQLALMKSMGITTAKFLVIVPKSAVPTWKTECFRHTPDIYQDMIIYPYSQLHNAVKSLRYWDIRFLVFDESHAMKSPETSRIDTVANFLRAIHNSPSKFGNGRIILATGTTMPNGAQELYTSWAMCCAPNLEESANRLQDRKRYEEWKMSFSQKKAKKFEKGRGKFKREEIRHTWSGVDNEHLLKQLLDPFVHLIKSPVELPPKQEIPIDLGLPDDKLLADANIEEPDAYMALLERLARAKTPYMMEWVEDYLKNSTEQLVVFAMYRFPIEELVQKFPKHVRLITGAEKGVERAQNLADFQAGKFRILAMTFKAGSESLNCQNAHTALYHGYPWTDATLRQAMARIFRQGQTKNTLHYFLTSGENDMRILDIVLRKAQATGKVESLLMDRSPTNFNVDDFI
jgi:hypothetical protein